MTCAECREMLLEAEPQDLVGSVNTMYSEHLSQCQSCRAAAASLDVQGQLIARAWESLSPCSAAGEVASAALRADQPMSTTPLGEGRWVKRYLVWGVGVAAAASAILVLSLRNESASHAKNDKVGAAVAAVDAVQSVVVPEGRNAILMKTNNPDITVLWFY